MAAAGSIRGLTDRHMEAYADPPIWRSRERPPPPESGAARGGAFTPRTVRPSPVLDSLGLRPFPSASMRVASSSQTHPRWMSDLA